MGPRLVQLHPYVPPSFPFSPAPDRNQTFATEDDTAATASNPSTTPASHRTAQSLRTYTSNKSVRTGSSPQTKPTSTPYKYAPPPTPLSRQRTVPERL